MNIFDLIIAAIIVYCVIRGIFRGIIKEASSIIGVLAGLYAAYTYYPSLSKDLLGFKNLFSSGEYVDIISFLLLFSIVFLMVGALGILIRFLLKIVFMAWVDRLFGGVFGFVRGFMISSVLVLVLTTFLSSGAPVIRESALCPFVASAAGVMSSFAGNAMRSKFNSNMNAAKKSWDNPDEAAKPESPGESAIQKKPAVQPKSHAKVSPAPKKPGKNKTSASEKKPVRKKTGNTKPSTQGTTAGRS